MKTTESFLRRDNLTLGYHHAIDYLAKMYQCEICADDYYGQLLLEQITIIRLCEGCYEFVDRGLEK